MDGIFCAQAGDVGSSIGRAGCADLEVHDGEVVDWATGAVDTQAVQTAGTAEHGAALMLVRQALQGHVPLDIVTNCSSVLSSVVKGVEWATRLNCPHAGVWAAAGSSSIGQVTKVKANLSRPQVAEWGVGQLWLGNFRVD